MSQPSPPTTRQGKVYNRRKQNNNRQNLDQRDPQGSQSPGDGTRTTSINPSPQNYNGNQG